MAFKSFDKVVGRRRFEFRWINLVGEGVECLGLDHEISKINNEIPEMNSFVT